MDFFRVPKWLLESAVYGNEKQRFAWIRIFFGLLDIRPRLLWNIFKLNVKRIASRGRGNKVIGHLHTPKTAGTYMHSLQEVCPHVHYTHMVIRKDRSDKYCPVGFSPISSCYVKDVELFSNVRNPLLLLSSYYYHSKGYAELVNTKGHDYDLAQKGFEHFVEGILSRDNLWPSRKFLFPNLFDQSGKCIVSWLNRVENLDADLADMGRHYNFNYQPQSKKRESEKDKKPEALYPDWLLEKVKANYSREMSLFGYDGFSVVEPMVDLRSDDLMRMSYNYASDEFYLDGILFDGKVGPN